MDTMLILIRQILQMFLLTAIGFLLFKRKKVTPDGGKTLRNVLIYVALPSVIIQGFLIEGTPEHMLSIVVNAAAAALLLVASLI